MSTTWLYALFQKRISRKIIRRAIAATAAFYSCTIATNLFVIDHIADTHDQTDHDRYQAADDGKKY